MKTPYQYFMILAVLCTIVLFALDSDPYSFTLPSIIGYILVGMLYITCIFLALCFPYYIYLLVRGHRDSRPTDDM